jgi:hypothetical protein
MKLTEAPSATASTRISLSALQTCGETFNGVISIFETIG